MTTRYRLLKQHKQSCPDCLPKRRQQREFDHCPYGDQLFELQNIYNHRLAHLEFKESARRFAEAQGRPHSSIRELMKWVYADEDARKEVVLRSLVPQAQEGEIRG